MNWLDITLLCLAGIGMAKGLFDGLIKQVVSLIALVVGILFCGKMATWLRGFLIDLDWFPPEVVSIVSYVLGFLMVAGVVLAAGDIVHRIVGVTALSVLNHLAGGLFGIIITVIFLSLFFNLVEFIDRKSVFLSRETKIESRFYYFVKEIVPTIYPHSLFTLEE